MTSQTYAYWTSIRVRGYFHPHLEQMYFTLNGQFNNVNNVPHSTLGINPRGHDQPQAPISVAKVITGHYNRGHIDLVSGHLTICTQISTGIFLKHPGLISILTSTNQSVLSSPFEHTGSIHKTRPLFKPWPPARDVLSQNIQSCRENLTVEYQKLPSVHLSSHYKLNVAPFYFFYVKERACLARPIIRSGWRHQKMNRSPRSPTVWWVINLVIEMWAECNSSTVTAIGCGTMRAKGKYSENIQEKELRCKLHPAY